MICTTPPQISLLKAKIPGIVIGNTLIQKSTNTVHRVRVREITEAITLMREYIPLEIGTIDFMEIEPFLPNLPATHAKRLRATIKDRDITREALKELQKPSQDWEYLGRLLDEHQTYLRDDFEVSHPKIEKMLNAGRSRRIGRKSLLAQVWEGVLL